MWENFVFLVIFDTCDFVYDGQFLCWHLLVTSEVKVIIFKVFKKQLQSKDTMDIWQARIRVWGESSLFPPIGIQEAGSQLPLDLAIIGKG